MQDLRCTRIRAVALVLAIAPVAIAGCVPPNTTRQMRTRTIPLALSPGDADIEVEGADVEFMRTGDDGRELQLSYPVEVYQRNTWSWILAGVAGAIVGYSAWKGGEGGRIGLWIATWPFLFGLGNGVRGEYLRGKVKKTAPRSIELMVKRRGYATHSREVTVPDGLPRRLTIELLPGRAAAPEDAGDRSPAETARPITPAEPAPADAEPVEFCGKRHPATTWRIVCHDSSVTDLTPLANLPRLRMLDLALTQVSDLTPLAALHQLEELLLDDCPIDNVQALAGLESLKTLGISKTRVLDLSPLRGLGKLKSLDISFTRIEKIDMLFAIRSLESLMVLGTPIPRRQLLRLNKQRPGLDIYLTWGKPI